VAQLDGLWNAERVSGALPPLWGVRKRIRGASGWTSVGPLRVPFEVSGNELHYRTPFRSFVDVLDVSADGARCTGRATFRGREFARFDLTRLA
jgi:hypothetical protein